MEQQAPPVRVIAPGAGLPLRLPDNTSPMFHQVEGLLVDEDVSFTDLKGVAIDCLLRHFFERDLAVRFRPSYFRSPNLGRGRYPVRDLRRHGLRVCKHSGWKCSVAAWYNPGGV